MRLCHSPVPLLVAILGLGLVLFAPAGEAFADEAPEDSEESEAPGDDDSDDETTPRGSTPPDPSEATDGLRASTERALLVWGPSSANDDGKIASEALRERLDPTEPLPGRVLRISDWLGAARFRIGGSGQLIPCEALAPELPEGSSSEDEISTLVRMGKSALDELESETALVHFQTAEKRVPCQKTFLDRDTFHEIFFYGGIAAYFAGNMDEAGRMFRQSATINPSHDWSPLYGPEPQSTFLSAVQDVIARPEARVYGDMRGTNYVEVRLDGAKLDQTKAFESTIYPGVHLIQAVEEDGSWATFVRKLDEGASLTFFSNHGAEKMLLEGPDSVLASFASSRLSRRARDERLKEIYLVTLDPSGENRPRVIGWIAATGEWVRLERRVSDPTGSGPGTGTPGGPSGGTSPKAELTPAERRKQALLREPDYRTSTTFGFKYTTLIVCPNSEAESGRCANGAERQNDYVGGIVGIDVRLIKGLSLDFRFGAGFTDHSDGGTLLPEFGGGLRYRFLTGSLQPFVAVQGAMLVGTGRPDPQSQDQVQIYGGLVAFGGLDIEFSDGFRVTFEGGGGGIFGGEDSPVSWPIVHGHFALGRFLP